MWRDAKMWENKCSCCYTCNMGPIIKIHHTASSEVSVVCFLLLTWLTFLPLALWSMKRIEWIDRDKGREKKRKRAKAIAIAKVRSKKQYTSNSKSMKHRTSRCKVIQYIYTSIIFNGKETEMTFDAFSFHWWDWW